MPYGSDVEDKKDCTIKGIKLSEDGLKARLIVEGLREGYIHEIKCKGVKSKSQDHLLHDFGYYTLNAIPTGTRLSIKDEAVKKAKSPQASSSKEKIQTESNTRSYATTSTVKPENQVKSTSTKNHEKNLTKMPESWRNGPDKTITVGTKPGMKFDLENFEVKPGTKVKLVFQNNDDMQHNLVVVLPNTANEVGEMALSLGLDGSKMNYVPITSKVLYHTKLLQPSSTEEIYFIAPEKEGEYQYVCTYPGHYIAMRGKMKVTK
jgi:azurin